MIKTLFYYTGLQELPSSKTPWMQQYFSKAEPREQQTLVGLSCNSSELMCIKKIKMVIVHSENINQW